MIVREVTDKAPSYRFWSKIRIGPDCWEWQGAKSKDGYGLSKCHISKRLRHAHRRMYEWYYLDNYAVPEGIFVCHKCDNPSCVRPDHLFLGTPRDNTRDSVRKGRMHLTKQRRLTYDQAQEIRQRYAEDPRRGKQTELAREYGVHQATVRQLLNGNSYVVPVRPLKMDGHP